MNKADLIDALEEKLGSRQAANDAINTVVDTIVRAVSNGERVAISGFGTFEKVERAARTGRNPRTGETVRIKKTHAPRFKPGGAFKAFVESPRSIPKAMNSNVPLTARVTARADANAQKPAAKKPAAKKTAAKKSDKAPAAKKASTKGDKAVKSVSKRETKPKKRATAAKVGSGSSAASRAATGRKGGN